MRDTTESHAVSGAAPSTTRNRGRASAPPPRSARCIARESSHRPSPRCGQHATEELTSPASPGAATARGTSARPPAALRRRTRSGGVGGAHDRSALSSPPSRSSDIRSMCRSARSRSSAPSGALRTSASSTLPQSCRMLPPETARRLRAGAPVQGAVGGTGARGGWVERPCPPLGVHPGCEPAALLAERVPAAPKHEALNRAAPRAPERHAQRRAVGAQRQQRLVPAAAVRGLRLSFTRAITARLRSATGARAGRGRPRGAGRGGRPGRGLDADARPAERALKEQRVGVGQPVDRARLEEDLRRAARHARPGAGAALGARTPRSVGTPAARRAASVSSFV